MKQQDFVEAYDYQVLRKLLKLCPMVAGAAALTFTVARLCGLFPETSISGLIVFDSCFLFFVVTAIVFVPFARNHDGSLKPNAVRNGELLLIVLMLLQWNLITYLFPTRTMWGYGPLFILMSAFFFHTWAVIASSVGISVSIAVSWLILGDRLLPEPGTYFAENLVLRIVCLSISFFISILLTSNASRFKRLTRHNTKSLAKKNEELEQLSSDIITYTAELIEQRDSVSGIHVKRVRKYTRVLAREVMRECPEYHLTPEDAELISMASPLHDVGKIAIPDSVLLKPGKLTKEEFDLIKTHTLRGAAIVDRLPERVSREYRSFCRDICLYHHERWDGSGYPEGLAENAIPIAAQIVAVVDCYEALTSRRPYKDALPSETALKMILNGECGSFSEKLLSCLKNVVGSGDWTDI